LKRSKEPVLTWPAWRIRREGVAGEVGRFVVSMEPSGDVGRTVMCLERREEGRPTMDNALNTLEWASAPTYIWIGGAPIRPSIEQSWLRRE